MTDAIAEYPKNPFQRIVFKGMVIDPNGYLTEPAQDLLKVQCGGEVVFLQGSTSKSSYYSPNTGEVFLFTKQEDGPIYTQSASQIAFYERFSPNPIFSRTVAPMTKLLINEVGGKIGMVQKYISSPITDFRTSRHLDPGKIDEFIDGYRAVINLTDEVHDDLITVDENYNYSFIDWEHVRINPESGQIYFIDYHGRNGGRNKNLPPYQRSKEDVSPQEKSKDPELLRTLIIRAFTVPK